MAKFDFDTSVEFANLRHISKNINEILKDEMWLISGDFSGIQKFIFDGLKTKNAAKVLRAKSAFIQLFSEFIAKYICEQLGISHDKHDKNIIALSAGKFEILSYEKPNLSQIQNKINEYFIKNFYGLTTLNLVCVECKKSDFSSKNYQNLRKKIADELEKAKFTKFDLANTDPVMSYDENITNQTLCEICNIRKKSGKNCEICDSFVWLGEKLVDKNTTKIDSAKIIKFDDFSVDLELDEHIKLYVCTRDGKICDFEYLAELSCANSHYENGEKVGVKALGILKADVDSMGNFIKDNISTYDEFEVFSGSINNFFSLFVPKLMRENFPHTYTIFAGGDDLFLVGAWDEIIELSHKIKDKFAKFTQKRLTISFGIAIAKANTPISYLAGICEHLLENSKAMDGKDAITLFGESAKWSEYISVYGELMPKFQNFSNDDSLNTAFLYRLLEFCEMSKNVKENAKNAMWKSKLNYAISRNQSKNLQNELYAVLDEKIEKNPKECKMVISQIVYKRRKR